jgi:hypothetical protein
LELLASLLLASLSTEVLLVGLLADVDVSQINSDDVVVDVVDIIVVVTL